MEISQFAPVIIPTLCRYKHFKGCVESLMQCTHAEKTDVFICFDFPSKDSHWKGHHEISNYLKQILNNNPFKSFNIIYRNKNYGTGRNGNLHSLIINQILPKYDSFIITEDDNEFSPSFLDYINKGLQYFKNDTSVLAICGYRHFYNLKFENNTFFRQNIDFSAWGYGIWRDRWLKIEQLNSDWFKARISIKNLWHIKNLHGNNRLLDFISVAYNNDNTITDNLLSVYMACDNLSVIMPKESLVKNYGWDGSGTNCKTADKQLVRRHLYSKISTQSKFEFIGNSFEYFSQNNKIYVAESYGNFSTIELIRKLVCKGVKYALNKKSIKISSTF